MRTRRTLTAAGAGAVAVGGYAALQWLGRTAGSTRPERKTRLPGDHLVERPHVVTDHALTMDAPAAAIWPWLVQMGWHRGGFYTARWVDAILFPDNAPSAERIHAEWQSLAVGDTVPDGAPETECFFVVDEIDPRRHLVLYSRSHLPPDFRDRFGARIRWSWTFLLTDLPDGRCRVHVRSRARLAPRWLAASYAVALIPADVVMAGQMLHGLRRRAERTAVAFPADHRPRRVSSRPAHDPRGRRTGADQPSSASTMTTTPNP